MILRIFFGLRRFSRYLIQKPIKNPKMAKVVEIAKKSYLAKKSKMMKKPEIEIFLACPPVQVQAKERIKSFRFQAAGLIEP